MHECIRELYLGCRCACSFGSLFMVKVYVCYAMTCIGLCDIWVRGTHELYGDLDITSGQYASRDMVWQLSLPGMWY